MMLGNIQDCDACPIFYQFVTDHIFCQLIKRHFPVEASYTQPLSQDLTYEEESGLRYAAGYMCRAMKNKFATTDSDIALCVNELIDDDGQGSSDWSSEWTKLVSRGGLVHIKDTTYMVFRTMDLLVQQYFQMSSYSRQDVGRSQIEYYLSDKGR